MSKSNHKQEIIKPSLLAPGAIWGVIGLSSPCEPSRFSKAKQGLSSLGFGLKVALDPCAGYGQDIYLFSSASPEARARALEGLFADKAVSAIIAARGGYSSMEVLPLLNFDIIRSNPKPLVGFSDTTALLLAIYKKSRMLCFHGPAFEGTFGRLEEDEQSRRSANLMLEFFSKGLASAINVKLNLVSGQSQASIKAPLIGGNLATLCHLIGTEWEASFDDHILFFEDIGEKPYSVHRMLLQMKLAGMFKNLKGVILGQFADCSHDKAQGPELAAVFKDIFDEFSFPVLGYAPFGHKSLNLVMPIGGLGLIKGEQFSLAESPFC